MTHCDCEDCRLVREMAKEWWRSRRDPPIDTGEDRKDATTIAPLERGTKPGDTKADMLRWVESKIRSVVLTKTEALWLASVVLSRARMEDQ